MSEEKAYLGQPFIGFFTSDVGAAIYIKENISLEVKKCFFECCIAKIQGGAIYFEGTSFAYTRNCAEICYILNVEDNKFGNLLSATCSLRAKYIFSSAFKCGPNSDVSADSTTSIIANEISVRSSNFSECISNYGTSGPFLQKYGDLIDVTIHKGYGYFGIYFQYNGLVKQIIILGTLVNREIFYAHATTEIVDSIIFTSCEPDKLANSYISFINCIGNVTLSGVTFMQTFFDIHIKRCNNNIGDCTIKRSSPSMVFISLMTIVN